MAFLLLMLIPIGYLFLIAPRLPRRPLGNLAGWDYAHRGLWNEELPENSLPAFQNAMDHGFGMEMDVHLTADDKLVVFHDDSLQRMCGDPRRIADCTLADLAALRLNGREPIPTLDEFLKLVRGQVPLIVEIKTCKRIDRLCALTAERLDAYSGDYCIESFDPRAVAWFRKHRPSVIRGQLAFGLVKPSANRKTPINRFVASLTQNVLGRPDFIAFEAETDHSLPMRLARLFRPWLVAWTVRDAETMRKLRGRYDLQIFEGFVPENRHPKTRDEG